MTKPQTEVSYNMSMFNRVPTIPTPNNWHHKGRGKSTIARSDKPIQTVREILVKRAGFAGFRAINNTYPTIQAILDHRRQIEGLQNSVVRLGDEVFH